MTPTDSTSQCWFPKVLPFQRMGGLILPEISLLKTTITTVSSYYGLVGASISLTVDITLPDGAHAEATIDPSSWAAFVEQLTYGRGSGFGIIKVKGVANQKQWLTVYIQTTTRTQLELETHPTSTVRGLMSEIHDAEGIPFDQMILVYNVQHLMETARLVDYHIRSGSMIELHRPLRGNSPSIYLYPPKPTDVDVDLSLCPEWTFHSVYPTAQRIEASKLDWEYLEWKVLAKPNGELDCFNTGAVVPSLCWEAKTNTAVTANTIEDVVKPTSTNGFSPAQPSLTPLDPTAVVLETTKARQYLERELMSLGLNFTQREQFITHWLPAFSKHTHIALRFLPQAAYDSAAPLEITPKPACITRVFMLFRGIKEKDLAGWGKGTGVAVAKPWAEVVGVDKARMHDEGVFRVLEWGGMEVF